MTQVNVNVQLSNLFSDLQRCGDSGDYEKALKVTNKILNDLPDDDKALHCKVVCQVQLGQFEDALFLIRKHSKLQSCLQFEKAYCEYRLNRTDEALRTIQSVANPDNRLLELYGQVLYRLEDYNKCFGVYKDLVKNTQDEFEDERHTNLSAVLAALNMWGNGDAEGVKLREDTYEMCYNSACGLIGQEQYTAAMNKLKIAEQLCCKLHEEEGETNSEERDAELCIIWVQMGYVLQKLGQQSAAMKLYNQVIKQRPSDMALAAVASNNIITINKDQNVFDSKKKIKVATVDSLKHKLTSSQRRTIAFNECLLHMYSGQGDQCKKLAQTLRHTFKDCDTPTLIEAAQYLREKNVSQAVECLESQLDSCNDAVRLKLTLAQLHLHHEHIFKACDVMRTITDENHLPGLVSALVTLYTNQEDKDSAAEVLSRAVDWYHAHDPKSNCLPTLVRANANFHLQFGSPQIAVQMLEELLGQNKSDLKTLAQLITAYSKFDAEKARLVSKQLPSVEQLARDVDIESLEASLSQLSSKYVKKGTTVSRAEPSPRLAGSPDSRQADGVVEKKKRKRRKKLLPKNYDPNATPDPERWQPLRERSYYRGKRKNKKRDIGKGTQGAVQGSTDLDVSKSVSPSVSDVHSPKPTGGGSSTPTAGTSVAGPRQQMPQAAAAKQRPKKKKGGGGKW